MERPFYTCALRYPLDKGLGVPLTACPKPRTFKVLRELQEVRDKYKLTLEELARWKGWKR